MFGLEIYNDSGTVSISDDIVNLGIIERGIISGTRIQSSIELPLLAIGQSSKNAVMMQVSNDNGIWTWDFAYDLSGVPYYIFGPYQSPNPTNGVVFQVFNASGALTFSATDKKVMRIVDVLPAGLVGPRNYPSDRQYAVACTLPRQTYQTTLTGEDGSGNPTRTSVIWQRSYFGWQGSTFIPGNEIWRNENRTYKTGDVAQDITVDGGSILIIDITNL
jgi:hypothetical protein